MGEQGNLKSDLELKKEKLKDIKLAFVVSIQETKFDAVCKAKNISKIIGFMKLLGYDGVETAIKNPTSAVTKEIIDSILKDHNLPITAVGTGQAFVDEGLSLTSEDEKIRLSAIKRIIDHIKFASSIIPKPFVIIGLIRGKSNGNKVKALDLLKTSLDQISDIAIKEDVYLLLEPINRYETDLLNNTYETIDFISSLEKPQNIKILADLFHMNIEEPDIIQSLKLLNETNLLGYVHIADSNRYAPGYGHLPIKQILLTLFESGYKGWVSGEMMPKPSLGDCLISTRNLFIDTFKGR